MYFQKIHFTLINSVTKCMNLNSVLIQTTKSKINSLGTCFNPKTTQGNKICLNVKHLCIVKSHIVNRRVSRFSFSYHRCFYRTYFHRHHHHIPESMFSPPESSNVLCCIFK